MKYNHSLTDQDLLLIERHLTGFIPGEIYDIHTHPYDASHFAAGAWTFLEGENQLDCKAHISALKQYMPAETIHGLYFGMPHKTDNRDAMNDWVASEVRKNGTALSRALRVTAPQDDPKQVASELRNGTFIGLKVYHCYAQRTDTMNAGVTEYVPEWMWEILDEVKGVLLLHIVRDGAMDDADNQKEIRRLCRSYPRVRLILAHVARSFSYRNARNGLYSIADLDNVVVDTSAVTESESFAAAIRILGPQRILWGSDFPVSEMRGRCITTGSHFYWLHPEVLHPDYRPPTTSEMTLVGIESLITLREACEDAGLTKGDIEDIFRENALRFLVQHLPANVSQETQDGRLLWQRARQVISGGTGLLSKRAEMFGTQHWPAYFSRASGCRVWDLAGKQYIDFAGGIGAVLLGYSDPQVNAAIQRRVHLGTYCSLVNPQETELAEKLLALHPWAGKVRYARGGGEAMAVAVRIARAATGRSGIAFCGYHGWHDWYLAANLAESNALDGHLLPGLAPQGVPRELMGTAVPFYYNDFVSFEAALTKLEGNLAAVVMEPVRSREPADQFLEKVAARCREIGGILVIDEITSGLRYGFPGAAARFGLEPDIAVYAKAMSNGIPFATVIGRDSVMEKAADCFISSSYWTDGIGPAAALAVLEKMERLDVFQSVWQKGIAFSKRLKDVAARYPACRIRIDGMPPTPLLTFCLEHGASEAKTFYIRGMCEKGFLVSSAYYLMLAHEQVHIDAFFEALEPTLSLLEQAINSGVLTSSDLSGNQLGFARLV